jgi:hypothetical protein
MGKGITGYEDFTAKEGRLARRLATSSERQVMPRGSKVHFRRVLSFLRR